MILKPLQKLPKNVGDLSKSIVAEGFKNVPKFQKIARSGHSDCELGCTSVPLSMLHLLLPWIQSFKEVLREGVLFQSKDPSGLENSVDRIACHSSGLTKLCVDWILCTYLAQFPMNTQFDETIHSVNPNGKLFWSTENYLSLDRTDLITNKQLFSV